MKIIGKAEATAEQMAAYLLSVNPEPKINMPTIAFCRLFLYMGALEGVRGDALFAQSCKETGNFKFLGTVKPEQNNYAGLGTTDANTPGATFPDEATGILAQAQHAKAYATTDALNYERVDPRYDLVVQIGKSGTAPEWEDLGGKWAVPGYDVKKYASLDEANKAKDSYGWQIVDILNRILGTSAVETEDEAKEDATMEIGKCILTKNDCYKAGKTITPKGIVVHSTGANNPNLRRYVQPDDGTLGNNPNNNDWNRSGVGKCVHAFIGKDKNGIVRVYQTLPWNMRSWGSGSGKKGSYNNSHIQFEICEDALNDAEYFNEAFRLAVELCAYLCKEYGIAVDDVVSHHEAYELGYASNHADCDHWLAKFGKDMNWFRKQVDARLGNVSVKVEDKSESSLTTFIKGVQKACGAKVDGIAGAETLSKTVTVSKTKNPRHAVVKPLQVYLNAIGYPCGSADGVFGTKTHNAVVAYQKDNDCVADGEVTAKNKTWKKLLGLA